MYKVIIWGTGAYYSQYLNMIKAQEVEGKLQVVAITSDDNYIHKLDTYVFIPKEKINYVDFDYCIVAMKDFQAALREMAAINIDENKLIPVRVFSIPYFDFEQYIKIKAGNISIISRNCWGEFVTIILG